MSDTEEIPMNEPEGQHESESDVDLVDLLEDDDSAEPEDDASDEFELDGEKLSKKEVKELLAKRAEIEATKANMQKDYTQKTMALAEVRKNAEALAEARESKLRDIGDFHAQATQELQEFNRIDWEKVAQTDPENFPAMYALAQSRAQQRQFQIQQAEQAAEELTNQRASEEWSELIREVPDLADPVKGAELDRNIHTVLKHFGISQVQDHKVAVLVAKMLPVLEKANKWDELQTKAKAKSRSNASSNAPEPAVSARAVTSSKQGLDDKLPMDEWLRRREAELKQQKRR